MLTFSKNEITCLAGYSRQGKTNSSKDVKNQDWLKINQLSKKIEFTDNLQLSQNRGQSKVVQLLKNNVVKNYKICKRTLKDYHHLYPYMHPHAPPSPSSIKTLL